MKYYFMCPECKELIIKRSIKINNVVHKPIYVSHDHNDITYALYHLDPIDIWGDLK